MVVKAKNLALVAKLCWRFRSNPEPWAEVLKCKYLFGPKPRKHALFRTWTTSCKGDNICTLRSRWIPRTNSTLNFWFDKWLIQGNIRSLIYGPFNLGEESICINNIYQNGIQNFHRLSFVLLEYVMLSIKALAVRQSTVGDNALVQCSSSNGEFDSRNAYSLALNEKNDYSDFSGQWIWKLKILPKIQFMVWKCFHGSLPVKDVLFCRNIVESLIC